MKIKELIEEFYQKEKGEVNPLCFVFDGLDHNEPCDFTKFNSFLLNFFEKSNNYGFVLKYPAGNGFVLSLVFYKTIYDLFEGNSGNEEFDPKGFYDNQIIKIGSTTVCFHGFFSETFKPETNDIEKIKYVKLSFHSRRKKDSSTYYELFKLLPSFEPVNSNSKLSTFEDFSLQKEESEKQSFLGSDSPLEKLKIKKSLKHETAILVTNIKRFKDLIPGFLINGEPILEYINISYGDNKGKLVSLNGGQTIPEIILVKNIEDAYFSIDQNPTLSFKYLYIDLNYIPDINNDMAIIDEISSRSVKFLFFLPENKEYVLDGLQSRGFNSFSWKPYMITPNMIAVNNNNGSYMLQNFRQNSIQPYLISEDPFSKILSDLHNISLSIDDTIDSVKSFYCSVIRLLFFEIRNCSSDNYEMVQSLVSDCLENQAKLQQSDSWIYFSRKDLVSIICAALSELKLFSKHSPKQEEMEKKILLLPQLKNKKICVIIPDDNDCQNVFGKLNYVIQKNKLIFDSISVKTTEEFFSSFDYFDYVIIVGWLNKQEMKRIIFSNKSRRYVPVLYSCEYNWFTQSVSNWTNELILNNDLSIFGLENEAENPKVNLCDKRWVHINKPIPSVSEIMVLDDYHSKIFNRKFIESDKDKMVDSVPIAFNDGKVGYFSPGYSFLVLFWDKYEMTCSQVPAQSLKTNMLVLFRESSKDLLNDLTNAQLGNNCEEMNSLVNQWKSVIQRQIQNGLSDGDVIERLKLGGIRISNPEFRIWLDPNNGLICPGSKDSLRIIGKVFNDNDLLTNIDLIWSAASRIRGLHIQIGRSISNSISNNKEVIDKLSSLSDSTIFNKAVDVDIPSLGTFSILKVTDIDQTQKVPRRETNRRK